MLTNISYHLIFGKPLNMYLGILTLLSFLFTATVGFLNYHGIHVVPFRWHPRLALLSLTLALIHGTLGILTYF